MTNKEIQNAYVGSNQAVKLYLGGEAVWPATPPPPEPVYSAMPLTFEIISAGTIAWFSGTANTKDIDYSLDDGQTWTTITSGPNTEINVSVGDKVQFKGYVPDPAVSFQGTAMFNACGNAFSIVDATGYTSITTAGPYCLAGVFSGCTGLVDASNMVLAPIGLSNHSYYHMFYGCKSLTTAPELPAILLGASCYEEMFRGCTSLTTAPSILPATRLDTGCNCCYRRMFYYCTNLTTAPELPATLEDVRITASSKFYQGMFYYCSNLNYIKCLATNIGSGTSIINSSWVSGVQTNSGTFVKHPDMTSWHTGNNGIPSGWTVIDA